MGHKKKHPEQGGRQRCPNCNGRGKITVEERIVCHQCSGTGRDLHYAPDDPNAKCRYCVRGSQVIVRTVDCTSCDGKGYI